MKYLREVLSNIKRLDTEDDTHDDIDLDVGDDADNEDDLLGNGNDEFSQGDKDEVGQDGTDIDLDVDDDGPMPSSDTDAPWSNLVGGASSGGPVDGAEPGSEDQDQDPDEEGTPEETDELDTIADSATEDPNRQGVIRTVKGAHLVYKRESQEGGFEELWIFNVTNLQDEMMIRKAILSGTDIPVNQSSSPDGNQTYKLWSVGNAEMLLITGLQN